MRRSVPYALSFASYFVGLIRSEEMEGLRKLVGFLATAPEEVVWLRNLQNLVRCLPSSASDVLASVQRQRRHRPLQPQQHA